MHAARNGDRNIVGGDRFLVDRGIGYLRRGDRWQQDRWLTGLYDDDEGPEIPGPPDWAAANPVENLFSSVLYTIYPAWNGFSESVSVPSVGLLRSAEFLLAATNAGITGTLVSRLYNVTGTTPNEMPSGPPLATSDPVDIATLPVVTLDNPDLLKVFATALIEFVFTGNNQVLLSPANRYCLTIEEEVLGGVDSSHNIQVGWSRNNAFPGGNAAGLFIFSGAWMITAAGYDLIFYLYTD